ncbi:UMP kinase [archaeon]|nr:UMP kinase [archaeon]NCP98556.1 UMP kinase [archaeon]NCQ52404.1 UMP kinase [archaeon]
MKNHKYKRVLLKLSGESLQGSGQFGYNGQAVEEIVDEIAKLHKSKVEIAIVIGGGNIMRGKSIAGHGVSPATADYMGMLATIMNAIYLQDVLKAKGIENRVMTAISTDKVAEPFIRLKALKHLQRGRIVILAAGTGNPFSTTDTAAALKAMELECEVIVKATKVDGIYDKDPNKYTDAVKYDHINYMDAITKNLEVMDMTAFTMCKDSKIPIIVCDILGKDNLKKIALGEDIGTLVDSN